MSTAAVELFNYEQHQVRAVLNDGEPWFVLADLCAVLRLSNPTMVADRLDSDALNQAEVIDSMGRPQTVTVVNEPGMYEVVIRSDKPEAVKFRRWLTHEVLPQIRRTGAYSSAPLLTGPELVATALIEASRMLEAKDERIAELESKAELADTYLTAQGGARLVRQVAKTFGMKESELRRFLLDEGLVFVRQAQCGDLQYDHYAHAAHYFLPRETVVTHQWGSCSHYTLYVLPRGVELIADRLRRSRSIEEPARS